MVCTVAILSEMAFQMQSNPSLKEVLLGSELESFSRAQEKCQDQNIKILLSSLYLDLANTIGTCRTRLRKRLLKKLSINTCKPAMTT